MPRSGLRGQGQGQDSVKALTLRSGGVPRKGLAEESSPRSRGA